MNSMRNALKSAALKSSQPLAKALVMTITSSEPKTLDEKYEIDLAYRAREVQLRDQRRWEMNHDWDLRESQNRRELREILRRERAADLEHIVNLGS